MCPSLWQKPVILPQLSPQQSNNGFSSLVCVPDHLETTIYHYISQNDSKLQETGLVRRTKGIVRRTWALFTFGDLLLTKVCRTDTMERRT